MVEEVNYDLLPFWISHEAIAGDDENERDVGKRRRRGGYQGTTMVSACSGPSTFFVHAFLSDFSMHFLISFVLH